MNILRKTLWAAVGLFALAAIVAAPATADLLGISPNHSLVQTASGTTTLAGGVLSISSTPIAIQLAPDQSVHWQDILAKTYTTHSQIPLMPQ